MTRFDRWCFTTEPCRSEVLAEWLEILLPALALIALGAALTALWYAREQERGSDGPIACPHDHQTAYRSGIIECDLCGERLEDPFAREPGGGG